MTKSDHSQDAQENCSALLDHSLIRPDGLIEVDSVLEIGPGIRPMQWYTPKNHTCVEPSPVYAKILADNGYTTWEHTAAEVLKEIPFGIEAAKFEQIIMLDVIEHMEKDEGSEVILDLMEYAPKQIVIYTPYGFLQQSGDAWGLGQDYWQEHRSGWFPEDFPGWTIQRHNESFFALWTPTAS